MINIGRLNKQITFYVYQERENEFLQTVQVLEKYKGPIWATVEPTKSEEKEEVERIKDIAYYTIYVRYGSGKDITSDMIIEYKGKKLEIISPPINNMEENVLVKIFCKHKVGDVIE